MIFAGRLFFNVYRVLAPSDSPGRVVMSRRAALHFELHVAAAVHIQEDLGRLFTEVAIKQIASRGFVSRGPSSEQVSGQ